MRSLGRSATMILFSLLAVPAHAVELRHVEVRRGTDGLASVPLSLANATGGPIVCVGELAHWYSEELGRAASGEVLRIPLWFDPATGTYSVLNDKRENMPVEALWCGVAGRAYATRDTVALRREAGAPPPAMALTCGIDGARLACQ